MFQRVNVLIIINSLGFKTFINGSKSWWKKVISIYLAFGFIVTSIQKSCVEKIRLSS